MVRGVESIKTDPPLLTNSLEIVMGSGFEGVFGPKLSYITAASHGKRIRKYKWGLSKECV